MNVATPQTPPGAGFDPMMLAVRALLADRLKLVMPTETRDLEIYALVMARPGGGRPGTGDCGP